MSSKPSADFLRQFSAYLSWEDINPSDERTIVEGAHGVASNLTARRPTEQIAHELAWLEELIETWDEASLQAIDEKTLGSWRESPELEQHLRLALETIAQDLKDELARRRG